MTRDKSYWYPLLGLSFVVTGADKLFGLSAYRRMFHEFGWSERQMRLVGAAELVGGTLLGVEDTRQLGSAVLASASAAVLAAELRHRDLARAGARMALLAAVVQAAWPTRRTQ
jgi:hypothetical protein